MKQRTIAIGDIHGCADTFFNLLDKLAITEQDEIYILGDFIDRGPNPKRVVHTIMALMQNGFNVKVLRGNHEQMFMDSELGFTYFTQWIQNGGEQTLSSFGVDFFNELDSVYQLFFTETVTHVVTDKYIFVHAGLDFSNDNIFENQEAMLWIRGNESYTDKIGNKKLVHGHTPIDLNYLLHQKGNIINIDGGCYLFHESETKGYLVALILDSMEYVYLKYDENIENQNE
jgi:serine/threonine protein phosphatase 1